MNYSLKKLTVIFYFSLLTLVPGFLYVSLALSSMSWGILFAGVFITLMVQRLRIISTTKRVSKLLIIVLTLMFLHALISTLISFSLKTLFSFVGLIILFVSANSLSIYLQRVQAFLLKNSLVTFSGFICVLLISSLFFDITIQNYKYWPSNVFPFSEPSHFTISSIPFLFISMWLLSTRLQIIVVFLCVLGGVLLPSLVLLISGLLLCFVLLFRNSKIFSLGLSVMIFLIMAYNWDVINNLNISYFSERIDFSEGGQNLSALVYMQGWERLILALKSTNGMGVGLQNLSTVELGFFGNRLVEIIGVEKNINDGSFIVAKLIAEFGIIGVFFVITYLKLAYDSSIQLIRFERLRRKHIFPSDFNTPLFIFSHSVIVTYFFELFIRGPGYFTTGTLLFLTGFFLINIKQTIPILSRSGLHPVK